MDILKKCWRIYDSLRGAGLEETIKTTMIDVGRENTNVKLFTDCSILQPFCKVMRAEHPGLIPGDLEQWSITVVPVPQQPSRSNLCGSYVMLFFKFLTQQRPIPTWTSAESGRMRLSLTWELIDGRIRI
jgi:hypothetical protein